MRDVYLAHYGVKGMKWGVRKAVEQSVGRLGSDATNVTKRSIDRGVRRKDLKKAKTMSDEELKTKIQRMNYEKQYAQLRADTDISAKGTTLDILKDVGGVTATAAVSVGVQALVWGILKGDG